MTQPDHGSSTRNVVRLMRDADVPEALAGGTFRYSPGAAALSAVLLVSGAVGLIAYGRVEDEPLAYYIGGLLLLTLWIYLAVVVARFRPSNWLVRVGERGLYIKFRSYLNHHFPEQDATVVYIPFSAMGRTRIVREAQELPVKDRSGASTTQRRTIVEIELDEEMETVANALARERHANAPKVRRWYGTSAGRYRHHPVRMSAARTIALEWGVVPRVSEFLRIMAVHTPVESSKVVRDYTSLATLGRGEQESRLRELVENGQVLDAIHLARRLYGYDITRAKAFVQSLAARAGT